MKKIKLISLNLIKSGLKKYVATFEIKFKNGKIKKKIVKFGNKKIPNFIVNKNIEYRNKYIKTHLNNLNIKDPTNPKVLTMYFLWNKKTLKSSLNDYKKRLNIYNRTNKFPKKIHGLFNIKKIKLNSFGKYKVPDNVKNKKLYLKIKNKIQKEVNKKKRRWGAYDSGRLVKEYKKLGGKYSNNNSKSKKNSDLDRWYKEKWIDACSLPKVKSCGRTKKTIKKKITYCRPSIIVDHKTPKTVQELTKKQILKRCKIKSKNPKKIVRN